MFILIGSINGVPEKNNNGITIGSKNYENYDEALKDILKNTPLTDKDLIKGEPVAEKVSGNYYDLDGDGNADTIVFLDPKGNPAGISHFEYKDNIGTDRTLMKNANGQVNDELTIKYNNNSTMEELRISNNVNGLIDNYFSHPGDLLKFLNENAKILDEVSKNEDLNKDEKPDSLFRQTFDLDGDGKEDAMYVNFKKGE